MPLHEHRVLLRNDMKSQAFRLPVHIICTCITSDHQSPCSLKVRASYGFDSHERLRIYLTYVSQAALTGLADSFHQDLTMYEKQIQSEIWFSLIVWFICYLIIVSLWAYVLVRSFSR